MHITLPRQDCSMLADSVGNPPCPGLTISLLPSPRSVLPGPFSFWGNLANKVQTQCAQRLADNDVQVCANNHHASHQDKSGRRKVLYGLDPQLARAYAPDVIWRRIMHGSAPGRLVANRMS
eukprot:scpid46809/ scgid24245/ 